jgi:ATP-binding cassette subfamily B protein
MSGNPHDLDVLAWDSARLGEAIEALAHKARLLQHPAQASAPPADLEPADSAALAQWVDIVAAQLGIEAEPVESSYADAERLVRRSAPALLCLPEDSASACPRFLALLQSNSRRATLLAPDLSLSHVPPRDIRRALCAPLEEPRRATIDEWLARTGVAPEQRARVGATILAEQLSGAPLGGGWLLRLSPAASVWQQARHARLLQPLLAIIAGDLVRQALLLVTWWVIGRAVFLGTLDSGWWWAWALLVFSGIPFQLLITRAQGEFATGLAGIFKTRLLHGTLKLQLEEIRHQGLGQFLGRIMDADAVELLAVSGGLTALVSVIELVIAAAVLTMGIGGWVHALLLGAWVLLTMILGWHYLRTNRAWFATHRSMTNDLVERMVGHRTRLAQEDPALWHAEEDRDLDRYLHLSERVDRAGMLLAAIPRAWMVVGLGWIAVTLAAPDFSPVLLAVGLGGVLLALQSLSSIIAGVQNVVAVTQAWDQVAPLFNAATRREEIASIVLPTEKHGGVIARSAPCDEAIPASTLEIASGKVVDPERSRRNRPRNDKLEQPLLTAKAISFRYREHGQSILNQCNLQIGQGDRLLLEGPSGGGKSTLAAVLAGLRAPESGLLLLWGYDRSSLGAEAWRQRIAVAPQFHENHVFTGTLAFNLLMGRRWPATPADLREAEEICRELGLGDLIRRMPSGLQQIVGESGWQLSHGERSRLYIARALLQNADLMILDESFAALDPETLALSLRCVLQRAPTLLVIAHP